MGGHMDVQEINIADIQVVENSRIAIKDIQGLMRDIEQHGLKQAIGVTQTKSKDYVLVFGHRRLSACKKLGWKKIPANVYPDMEMGELLIHNLGENLHREDTSPMELGRICDRLKKMGLNNSEISAKLSIPSSRIQAAMDIYHELPDRYRNKVSYISGMGNKKGNISASVASKLISVKRQYGLSDAAAEKLISVAKMDEMTGSDVNLIGIFLKNGYTVAQALEKKKEYKETRTDIYVNIKEMDALLAKYKMDSTIQLLAGILYGEIPHLKKPDFVDLKQLPDKKG